MGVYEPADPRASSRREVRRLKLRGAGAYGLCYSRAGSGWLVVPSSPTNQSTIGRILSTTRAGRQLTAARHWAGPVCSPGESVWIPTTGHCRDASLAACFPSAFTVDVALSEAASLRTIPPRRSGPHCRAGRSRPPRGNSLSPSRFFAARFAAGHIPGGFKASFARGYASPVFPKAMFRYPHLRTLRRLAESR